MNINGFNKQNKNFLNNKKCNCCKNNCNSKFNFQNLFEIENFLCNFRNACRCIKFSKFFK